MSTEWNSSTNNELPEFKLSQIVKKIESSYTHCKCYLLSIFANEFCLRIEAELPKDGITKSSTAYFSISHRFLAVLKNLFKCGIEEKMRGPPAHGPLYAYDEYNSLSSV